MTIIEVTWLQVDTAVILPGNRIVVRFEDESLGMINVNGVLSELLQVRSVLLHGLLQRRDLSWRLQVLRPVPGFAEFGLVNRRPFDYETAGARKKAALQHREGFDSHQYFISRIGRMEVRWTMISKVHAYDDPVKPAELRHLAPGTSLPA